MKVNRSLIVAIALSSLSTLLHAFSPDLVSVLPRGGVRGEEVELDLRGHRMFEPQKLICYKKGVLVKSLTKVSDKHIKVVVSVAADAALGEYPLRLLCKGGVTYMSTFWVGQFPTVKEIEPNDSLKKPQSVEFNVTIHGVSEREDADYYRVMVKKGQRISAELEAIRLGKILFDPYVAILDEDRRVLAAADDTALLRQDSYVSVIAPKDGEYLIMVRESSYEGNNKCRYRLHLGGFSRPSAVYPPAGNANVAGEFLMIGDPAGDYVMQAIPVGRDGSHYDLFALRDGMSAPSANPVLVSALPFANELEPNGESKKATPMKPLAAPCAFHGIIAKKEDVDWFRFYAKKGESLRIRVKARSLRSPLDSVLILRDADGKQLGRNDDQGGLDSIIDFKPSADGEYFINVRDQLGNGGPDYVYRVEIHRREPSLFASIPVGKRYDSQFRKMISVPRGNRYATVVNISRQNTSCECRLQADSLPAGVTMKHSSAPQSANNFLAVFEASADAPLAGGLHRFTISDANAESELKGKLLEVINFAQQNNVGVFHSVKGDRVAVAVINKAPFHVDLKVPPVPMVQNGTARLKVILRRSKGFDKAVKVTLPWKPPGVGAPTEITIEKGLSEAFYDINASGDAATGTYQLCVTAQAETEQGQVVVSSSLQKLTVAEPLLSIGLEMASAVPGEDAIMIGRVEHHEKIYGQAKVIMHGLPHGVTAPTMNIDAATKQLNFKLKVAKDAAKGKHNALFCQVLPIRNGYEIAHNTGHGGTLMVNSAPPSKKKASSKDGEQPSVLKPSKPLSRLEQLRERKRQ
ncbi:MAG: PPC domain-containing protein [Akkermansiaceae bacterium]|nr:PPC domain-containing protein [Akkermansiaceae bacterium]